MSLFIPKNQLRDMLQSEAALTLASSHDPVARMVALNSLMETQPRQGRSQKNDLWLEDNWLDDNNFFG